MFEGWGRGCSIGPGIYVLPGKYNCHVESKPSMNLWPEGSKHFACHWSLLLVLRLAPLKQLDYRPHEIDVSFDLIGGHLNQRKHTKEPSYPIIIPCSSNIELSFAIF